MREQAEFNKSYYDRFYRNPHTRAADREDAERCADFVTAYLTYLEVPVARIADVGCGLGHMLRRLKRKFKGVEADGYEYSEYLCDKYGWTQSSVLEFAPKPPYDLVVCNDVVQYLNDRDAAQAIQNLCDATDYALFFSVLTKEDWEEIADRARTDEKVHMRTADWYRRRLKKDFWSLGGGLFIGKDAGFALWHLDRI